MDGSFVWLYFCVPPMYGDYRGRKRTLDPWAWVCIHFSYVLCNHLICLADHRPSMSPTLLNFSALIWDVIHHSDPQFIFLYVKIHWEQYNGLTGHGPTCGQQATYIPHICQQVWPPRFDILDLHCETSELQHVVFWPHLNYGMYLCVHTTHTYTQTPCACAHTQSKLMN